MWQKIIFKLFPNHVHLERLLRDKIRVLAHTIYKLWGADDMAFIFLPKSLFILISQGVQDPIMGLNDHCHFSLSSLFTHTHTHTFSLSLSLSLSQNIQQVVIPLCKHNMWPLCTQRMNLAQLHMPHYYSHFDKLQY